MINATLYKTVELHITAVDNDTITFRVINKPAGAIENQSGHELYFTWNVTSSHKVGYKLSSAVDNENNKQLLDEVGHDIMNYQNRGLCYLPKQITQTRGFDNS